MYFNIFERIKKRNFGFAAIMTNEAWNNPPPPLFFIHPVIFILVKFYDPHPPVFVGATGEMGDEKMKPGFVLRSTQKVAKTMQTSICLP
jgi:hypothetical protein